MGPGRGILTGVQMGTEFDFVVIGGGSAGAALAARLSEDPAIRVALLEAGDKPPEHEKIPLMTAALQLDPETDWMYRANPGKGGQSLKGHTTAVPRGKMLGGSSGMNYMAYVRGHPGDYDNWAENGAPGWSFDEIKHCFERLEDVQPSNEAVIDQDGRGRGGPIGVAIRSPVIPASRQFVAAGEATGLEVGDYNGRARLNSEGVVSLFQTSTRHGRRCSSYRGYLEGEAEARDNLTIITKAHVLRLIVEDNGDGLSVAAVEYQDAEGATQSIKASKEIILSAGAIGSPHILMLSGIGCRRELEAAGIQCIVDAPHVGKHLKDHYQVPMFFPAPGIGVSGLELGLSLGPDALRGPDGPLPEDAADDVNLTPEQQAIKDEAQRRFAQWEQEGTGLATSPMYDAIAFFQTGLGDAFTHDGQIGFNPSAPGRDVAEDRVFLEVDKLFGSYDELTAPEAETVIFHPGNCVPHGEGEITIKSPDPFVQPEIDLNYFGDPHDLKVMVAVMRKALEIAGKLDGLGEWVVPPFLAKQHGWQPGQEYSDALLESVALHMAVTVYHLSCTCRMGDVVDERLRVSGVKNLRIADASVMPEIPSGNINAACLMIGERAAELIREDWAA